MQTGTVKWFNNAKGFGFICPQNGGEDIFAHYSTIQMEGYRTLKAGQQVNFDVHEGPKGNHASLIIPVESEAVAWPVQHHVSDNTSTANAGHSLTGIFIYGGEWLSLQALFTKIKYIF